ncbi:MAG TPA: 2-hydroxyacid dehydrogenase [Nitrososphaerales archaeon]|nr:2-hydroxyacid dehydrogenase [Nitrososphaerales archaeon]
MPKILCLSPLPASLVRNFFSQAATKYSLDISVTTVDKNDGELIKEELSISDYVIGDYSFAIPITAEMVERMKNVKLVQQPSTGYNHIDIAACARMGIPVANIGGANSLSVAEHSIALALILLKRIVYAHQGIVEGKWAQGELMNLAGELSGKSWGIVGLGRIGRALASRVQALGGKVLYYDSTELAGEEELNLGVTFRELPKLLSESDIVSIHTPLTSETTKMIGEKEFRLMKPSSIFINTSRGELVDEVALARALRDGWIAGSGVDVFSREPPPPDHPLIVVAKEGGPIVLTPHIAGATSEARERIIRVTVENILRVMLGQKPENVVNQ